MEVKDKHCIYLYTNIINGKKYIGQTNDFGRRIREHRNDIYNQNRVSYHCILARAMRKYGENKFTIKVIENNLSQEEANNREKYWIKYYDCILPNGYNNLEGGKDASNSRFTDEEINKIKEDLKNGITYPTIAKKWNIAQSYISFINHGKVFFDSNEIYPLSKKQNTKDDEQVQKIVQMLKSTNITLDNIAKECGVCKATVVKINNGSYHAGANSFYPIRKSKIQRREDALHLLLTTNLSFKEIANKSGASESTVRNINKGLYGKKEGINYPIRKTL